MAFADNSDWLDAPLLICWIVAAISSLNAFTSSDVAASSSADEASCSAEPWEPKWDANILVYKETI